LGRIWWELHFNDSNSCLGYRGLAETVNNDNQNNNESNDHHTQQSNREKAKGIHQRREERRVEQRGEERRDRWSLVVCPLRKEMENTNRTTKKTGKRDS
jgi:hypothetical protein